MVATILHLKRATKCYLASIGAAFGHLIYRAGQTCEQTSKCDVSPILSGGDVAPPRWRYRYIAAPPIVVSSFHRQQIPLQNAILRDTAPNEREPPFIFQHKKQYIFSMPSAFSTKVKHFDDVMIGATSSPRQFILGAYFIYRKRHEITVDSTHRHLA